MSHPELADEAIHLTSAFQLAEYRSVVGTSRPVFDRPAATMARAFYHHLTHDRSAEPDAIRAATALHQAIRNLRDKRPGQPYVWASYQDVGA